MPEVPSGNRNLVINTSENWGEAWTYFTGGAGQRSAIIYKIYNRGFKVGDKVHIRMVLKHSNIVASSGQTPSVLAQFEGNVTKTVTIGRLNPTPAVDMTVSDGEIELKSTTVVTEYMLQNEYWNWRLCVDYVASGHITWKEVKAEISETATPYSRAPEDLGWSTDTLVPTQSNRYLWKFEYTYYSDGSVEVTQPTNLSIAGADGTNGQTSHVHFAFADNATGGGFSLTTPKAYMGWYADFNETASNDPTKYRWGKWKGDQGVQGDKGDDGKTSYLHLAFASSADGKTGFSFKESGQQYQGYYTDFTQSSSTDPTKYTWMDRRAGVEVGMVNLLPNADFSKTTPTETTFTVGGKTYKNTLINKWGDPYNKWISNPTTNYHAFVNDTFSSDGPVVEFNETNGVRNWKAINAPIPSKDLTVGTYYFSADLYATGTGTKIWFGFYYYKSDGKQEFYSGQTTVRVSSTGSWQRLGGSIKLNADVDFSREITFYVYGYNFSTNSILYLKKPKLENGNVGTAFSLNPSDIDEAINSKADQALTQQQLNALAEQNSIVKAEMEAKASIDTVNQWITAYQNYVNANDEAKAESERNLQEAAARILQLKTDVGTLKQQWDFIDTYMTIQNEGLIIGKSDGSAYAKFSNDRISLFSGSSEVMYISQGVLRIENGIFTKTIQIGRFRFETHPADQDMLVLRYLGG